MAKIKTKYLGQILVDRKIITQEDLQESLLAQKTTPLRLGQLLVKKGMATEEEVLTCLAEQYDINFLPAIDFDDPDNLFAGIPIQFLKRNKMVPFRKRETPSSSASSTY